MNTGMAEEMLNRYDEAHRSWTMESAMWGSISVYEEWKKVRTELLQYLDQIEQLKQDREGIMKYLSNTEMTASGEPAMIFMKLLVGLFEQNGGKNFLALTVENKDKSARYSINIQNLNGELSIEEKLQQQEDEIKRLQEELDGCKHESK
jgi:hypothetical protein